MGDQRVRSPGPSSTGARAPPQRRASSLLTLLLPPLSLRLSLSTDSSNLPHAQDFRGDSLPNAAEILFRKVKFWEKGDAPPVFHLDGMNFLFVRKNGLLFGATTRFNVSPSTTIELLNRTAKVFKDYCGVLSEVCTWAVCVCMCAHAQGRGCICPCTPTH